MKFGNWAIFREISALLGDLVVKVEHYCESHMILGFNILRIIEQYWVICCEIWSLYERFVVKVGHYRVIPDNTVLLSYRLLSCGGALCARYEGAIMSKFTAILSIIPY